MQTGLAIKIQTVKDEDGCYQPPHAAFFAVSHHNDHVVHHGGINFGAGSDCKGPGDLLVASPPAALLPGCHLMV